MKNEKGDNEEHDSFGIGYSISGFWFVGLSLVGELMWERKEGEKRF